MTTETAATPAPAAPTTTTFALPESVQPELKQLIAGNTDLLTRLGALEADYVSAKNRLLTDIGNNQKARVDIVTKAAKDAGLDVENHVWSLDTKNMTLVKQAAAPAPAAEPKEMPKA